MTWPQSLLSPMACLIALDVILRGFFSSEYVKCRRFVLWAEWHSRYDSMIEREDIPSSVHQFTVLSTETAKG